MGIVTEISVWFVLLCMLLGILYTAGLYYKEKKSEFTSGQKWLMAVFRFLAVSIVSFLLLSPLVKEKKRSVEKPVIIFAQDNSASLLMCRDSAYYHESYPARINELIEKLKADYEVREYSFDEYLHDSLKMNFQGKQTNISEMFNELNIRYVNRNVGALIFASDGIYNSGSNPLYAAGKLKFPVYSIALGDTNQQKDIILKQVNYNKVACLGNTFTIEALITSYKCNPERSRFTITEGGKILYSKDLIFNNEKTIETLVVQLEADKSGIRHYRLGIAPVKDEISTSNNYTDIFVEVLDARQKILIFAGAPHPDIAALRAGIARNKNYEVDVVLQNELQNLKSLSSYNLIILHQVPFKNQELPKAFTESTISRIPVLYVLGSYSNIQAVNRLNAGLYINTTNSVGDESQPLFNNDFGLFNLSDKTIIQLSKFPPLVCPFGEYKTTVSSNVMFYQKIKNVNTKKPLLLFNQLSDKKIGFVCGEGLWRWRLTNYLQSGDHEVFNEIINKIIQYLSVKENKNPFRVYNNNNYDENENVILDAEVYNDSYELINEPEVLIAIKDVSGRKYPFTFSKTQTAYHLDAGCFPVGEYTYSAQTKVGSKVMQENGVFTVSPVNIESLNLIADHNILNIIANDHEGKMFYPAQTDDLYNELKSRDDIKSVAYSKVNYNEVINFFVIFVIVLALLTAEWLLRKRNGAY